MLTKGLEQEEMVDKIMKIAIIGYSGSGKSMLARELGKSLGISVLHIDCIHWLPGWQERKCEEEISMINEFLDTKESWVIDGNYAKLAYERRMEEADQIIFMNFNRFSCLCRAMKRFFKYKGAVRESMTEGCEEKIDFEFVKWILHDGRTKEYKKQYAWVLKNYRDKVVEIRNQKELTNAVSLYNSRQIG